MYYKGLSKLFSECCSIDMVEEPEKFQSSVDIFIEKLEKSKYFDKKYEEFNKKYKEEISHED